VDSRAITYVDAENGEILSVIDLVCHAKGMVYKSYPGTPEEVELPDIIHPSPKNDGVGIFGKNFRSFNTCQYYKCTGNMSVEECDEDHSICVSSSQAETYKENTIQHWFEFDARILDSNIDWEGLGYPGSKIRAVWNKAPGIIYVYFVNY
jgi:hypothetical protein